MLDFKLILQNDNVMLRPLVTGDFIPFLKLTGDKPMWIWFTNDLSVEQELKYWVDTGVNDIKSKTRLAFAIIDKSTGILMGSTSFGNISYRDKRIEIGWTWLGKQFQGKGINDHVKKLMLEYSFNILDFERVEFKTDVLNIPARKALLRIGATEEGILRSHTLMTHSRRRDTIYYSVLKSEWLLFKSPL